MSSEPPPLVNCDVYNYANWNVETGAVATKSWALYNFLSKRVADICQGVISFVSGIKTNSIIPYSGSILTLGGSSDTVSISNFATNTLTASTLENAVNLYSTNNQQGDLNILNYTYHTGSKRPNINIACGASDYSVTKNNVNILTGSAYGTLNTKHRKSKHDIKY